MKKLKTFRPRLPVASCLDGVQPVGSSFRCVPQRIGGVAMAMVAAHTKVVRRWIDQIRHTGERCALRRGERLRNAVVGNNKFTVAGILGLPPTTIGAESADTYLTADTWYYPLSNAHRVAIAIEFDEDVARSAKVLHVREGCPH